MGGAVFAHKSGAIDAERDVKLVERDIVHDLVKGTLEKRGIQRHHGLDPAERKAGRKGDGMRFRNAHVEEAVGECVAKRGKPGTVGHGGRDSHDVAPRCADVHQRLSKQELCDYFNIHYGFNKKLVEAEIAQVMKTFRIRKWQVIRTPELWQKVGLHLEMKIKEIDL